MAVMYMFACMRALNGVDSASDEHSITISNRLFEMWRHFTEDGNTILLFNKFAGFLATDFDTMEMENTTPV